MLNYPIFISFILTITSFGFTASYEAAVGHLYEQGSDALAAGGESLPSAISSYKTALAMLVTDIEEKDDGWNDDTDLEMLLSLYINLGTAYSAMPGHGDEMIEKAIEAYKEAIEVHEEFVYQRRKNDKDKNTKVLDDLAAQAAFFMGMEYQDINEYRNAADAYALAGTLDPYHWAAMGNLGSVLQDHLKQLGEAIIAYNKAFEIITKNHMKATDMPENPPPILSQSQACA